MMSLVVSITVLTHTNLGNFNYWTATARLSHICNDDSLISGFNANGVPMTLSVETTAKAEVGAGNVLTP